MVLKESRFRSILKAFSWRLVGTVDTFILSFFISNNFEQAKNIGLAELISKTSLYYLHERFWQFYVKTATVFNNRQLLLKAISWRVFGTIDTILLGWILLGSPLQGMQIGALELFTKVLLYFFHEKLWQKIPKGTLRKYFPYLEKRRIAYRRFYDRKRNTSNK